MTFGEALSLVQLVGVPILGWLVAELRVLNGSLRQMDRRLVALEFKAGLPIGGAR